MRVNPYRKCFRLKEGEPHLAEPRDDQGAPMYENKEPPHPGESIDRSRRQPVGRDLLSVASSEMLIHFQCLPPFRWCHLASLASVSAFLSVSWQHSPVALGGEDMYARNMLAIWELWYSLRVVSGGFASLDSGNSPDVAVPDVAGLGARVRCKLGIYFETTGSSAPCAELSSWCWSACRGYRNDYTREGTEDMYRVAWRLAIGCDNRASWLQFVSSTACWPGEVGFGTVVILILGSLYQRAVTTWPWSRRSTHLRSGSLLCETGTPPRRSHKQLPNYGKIWTRQDRSFKGPIASQLTMVLERLSWSHGEFLFLDQILLAIRRSLGALCHVWDEGIRHMPTSSSSEFSSVSQETEVSSTIQSPKLNVQVIL